MLQRVWAGIAAVWAVLAVFTVLALRQAPVTQTSTSTTHAVTSSSTVAARPAKQTSSAPVAAVTRSS